MSTTPVVDGIDETLTPQQGHPPLNVVYEWLTTVDHKKIGLMYIGLALIFLVVGGVEAVLMRIQLAIPNNHFVSPQAFNQLFTMHGTTMIFFVAMPVLFGWGNYLVPLMIGARDMAFPRLNAFSFWVSSFAGVLLYFSYVGASGLYAAGSAPDVGWFAYAPLTAKVFSPGHSTDYWTLAVFLSGIGSIGTALNIVTTIICMRCKGMKMSRMPAAGVAVPGDVGSGVCDHQPADRGANHADHGSLPGRSLFRYAGWRLGGAVDALLLDFWPSRSLCADPAVVRLCE
jgi:cytochrome c oxidase subunit I